ncbi:type II toxin-antitoxin system RelE/ParE family toxin [Aeromicrobium sp.]|uniref:type II toxin-antitoxin system RelE/ParE family toxin n=1 Tax=Aeromicrobium sp. TaxID=1871063 RepID=UPI002FC820F0
MQIAWHPEAKGEYDAEVEWYEARGVGLGDRFEAAVDDMVDTVVEWPESGAMWPGWDSIPVVRSRRVGGFPFRLVYLVLPAELVVVAIAHHKRLPGYWRERVVE